MRQTLRMRSSKISFLAAIAAAALFAAGCSSSTDSPAGDAANDPSTTKATSTSTTAPYRSEIYSQAANWLCRPETTNDACDVNLDATLLNADGSTEFQKFELAKDPSVDCFYVYPTISTDVAANSDLTPDSAEKGIAANQFARFGSTCRLFAPVYRQVPLAGIGLGSNATVSTIAGAKPPREIAYGDVADAWKHYLANDNNGRPVVLIGHSQGAGHLTRLIGEEIDPSPKVRKQLVSALLIGAGVPAAGTDKAFKNVPPCAATESRPVPTGCVVSYASFLNTEPPPADSYFGAQRDDAGRVICTNPGDLTEASAPLNSYLPAQPDQKLTTQWVRYDGLFTGKCTADEKFDWLEVTSAARPGDARPADPGGRLTPQWGLHLLDVNLTIGDLIKLVSDQAAALK